MVSPSKPNHSKVANNSSYKCKLVKGTKPLVNFKFFLDIQNFNVSNKIENRVKELGGSIEFFLSKEVTYFVTDKQSENFNSCSSPKTPVTPQTPLTSLSADYTTAISSPSHESKGGAILPRPRNRADAMLQQARLTNQDSQNYLRKSIAQSPVQIAKNYGLPIWSTEQTLKFLERVFNDLKYLKSSSAAQSKAGVQTRNQQNTQHHHHHSHTKRSNNAKILKGNYIKIEALGSRNFRPYYRELERWPTINLNISSTGSPFDSEATVQRQKAEMTRKNNRKTAARKTNQSVNTHKTDKDVTVKEVDDSDKLCNGGYCEICQTEFDILKQHLKTEKHLNYIKNDSNFLSLDNLIKGNSNVEEFLRKKSQQTTTVTASPARVQRQKSSIKKEMLNGNVVNGDVHDDDDDDDDDEVDDDVDTNDDDEVDDDEDIEEVEGEEDDNVGPKTRRTQSKTVKKVTKVSETKVMNGRLETEEEKRRSRRESCKRINYAEPREDEENNTADEEAIESVTSTRRRIRSIRWRAPSPDDRPPTTTNAVVYKVDTKKEPLAENKKDNSGNIKLKFKRVRQSELSLLSNEAESFMFPNKDNPDSSDTDEDRQSTSELAERSLDISSEVNRSSEVITRKGKRRGPVETDSMATPISSIKQRFQGALIQPKLDDDENLENSNSEDGMGEQTERERKIKNLSRIDKQFKYSFERVPKTEPWYWAFQRQDEGKEKIFEYYGVTAYRKLPYELGPLPLLPANCCELNRVDVSDTLPLTVANVKKDQEDDDDNNDAETTVSSNCVSRSSGKTKSTYISKKKMLLLESCQPRISPREHASTLAILSSVIHNTTSHRKLNKDSLSVTTSESNLNDIDENSCDSMIPEQSIVTPGEIETGQPTIPTATVTTSITTDTSVAVSSLTSNRLCFEIDKFFRNSFQEDELEDKLEINRKCSVNIDRDVENTSFIDIIKSAEPDELFLDQYLDQISDPIEMSDEIRNKKSLNHKLTATESLHLARTARKRKNNRTGWPTKRRITQNSTTSSNTNKRENIKLELDDDQQQVDDFQPQSQITEEGEGDDERTDSFSHHEMTSSNELVIGKNNNNKNGGERGPRRKFFFKNKLISDMFNVSSDSLDSTISTKLTKINPEDYMGQSIFVSDDSTSLDDDNHIIRSQDSGEPSSSMALSNNNKMFSSSSSTRNKRLNNNCNNITSCSSSNSNSRLRTNGKVDDLSKSYGLRSANPTPATTKVRCKRGHKKQIAVAISPPTTPSKLKGTPKMNLNASKLISSSQSSIQNSRETMSTTAQQQYSPRKLRKPRGRWYRER